MKFCKRCSLYKSIDEFGNDKQTVDGLRFYCKHCTNRQSLKYAHSQEGKTKRKEYNKEWSKKNAYKKNASCQGRKAAKLKATPIWADLEIVEGLYKQARELEKSTGIKHDVDHIVPLRSKLVCGLHVESNLRVIPSIENRIKGNKVWPDWP